MKPDSETDKVIRQQIFESLSRDFDHADIDDTGKILVVQDGYWFDLSIETLDNGEPIECGQCEGTGRTQSASNLKEEEEECPVCDGSGQVAP